MAKQIIVTEGNYGIEIKVQFTDLSTKLPIDISDNIVEVQFVDETNNVYDIVQGVIIDGVKGLASVVLDTKHTEQLGLHKTYWSVITEDGYVTAQTDLFYYVKEKNGGANNNNDNNNGSVDGEELIEYVKELDYKISELDKELDEIKEVNVNAEIIDARGDNNKLGDRLNKFDTSLDNIALSVKKFNAKGDGTTDDTLAIQNAINYAKNGNYEVALFGNHLITDSIIIPSNVKIKGINNACINLGGREWKKSPFKLEGVVRETKNLTVNTSIGDTSVTLENTNNIENNSLVILNSQRSAFGIDSGEFHRLGTSTATTDDCYFGEFLHVKDKTSTVLNLYNALMFGGYKKDNVGETDSKVKANSFVEVIDFIENVKIENIRFTNGSVVVNGGINIIDCNFTKDCIIKNVSCENTLNGGFIGIRNSFNTVAKGCSVKYVNTDVADHYYQNAYKTLSSQKCGFIECTSINGQQPFDLTYLALRMPSLECFIKDCRIISARFTGITTHPGTYSCIISDNNITSCGDGISVRGQGHQVNGNKIVSISKVDCYGIGFVEGYGNDGICNNNVIDSFGIGVRIHESYLSGRDTSYNSSLRLLINNNKITQTRVPFYVDRATNSTKTLVNANIQISNNLVSNFRNFTGSSIKACLYVGGDNTKEIININLTDNLFHMHSNVTSDIPTVLIRCECNATINVSRNTFTNVMDKTYIVYGTTTGRVLNLVFRENSINMLSGGYYITSTNQTAIDTLLFNTDTVVTTRPTRPILSNIPYFDKNIGKPIWWNGASWVDGSGVIV